jgi:ABC-type Fe3+ transport system substrate-binding protein
VAAKAKLRTALTVATFAFVLTTAPARAEVQQDLVRAAEAEGALSYYAQGPRQVYEDLVARFEARYPRIKVHVTPGRYDVIEKIDRQIAAGTIDVDVVTAQTVQDLIRWSEKSLLLSFTPEASAVIPAELQGRDFFPLSIYVIGLAYNPNEVKNPPRSVADLLDPRFEEKIVSTYPQDDDVTLYLYGRIVRKYGWSFIDKLKLQKLRFVRSHVLVGELTKTGERPVTFDQISSFNSVTFVVPGDIPLVVFPYSVAAFAASKHPNAARLFLEFSLSKEEQQRFVARNIWSARADVEPPAGFGPLSSYSVANDFIAFMSHREAIAKLRADFEKAIGPVSGEYISTSPPRSPR